MSRKRNQQTQRWQAKRTSMAPVQGMSHYLLCTIIATIGATVLAFVPPPLLVKVFVLAFISVEIINYGLRLLD